MLEYHCVDINNIYQMLDEALLFDCHERCHCCEVQHCVKELAGKVEELRNTRGSVSALKTGLLSACSEGARESDKMLEVRVSTKGERGAVWRGLRAQEKRDERRRGDETTRDDKTERDSNSVKRWGSKEGSLAHPVASTSLYILCL